MMNFCPDHPSLPRTLMRRVTRLMRISLRTRLYLALLAAAPQLCGQSASPDAAAHRADPRTPTEIQQANLRIKAFPNINPDLVKDRADIPAWWQSSLDERDAFFAAHLWGPRIATFSHQ